MAQALSPQFRPGIVVFVGKDKESENIRRHLWMLLQSLDVPLRRCIGLIQYESNTSAYALSAEEELPQGAPATGTSDFLPVFRRTLSRVQGERGRQNVIDTLSPMPDVQTQIYIVGQAYKESHELSAALEAILRQLRNDVLDTQICYVLNEYGRVNTGGVDANAGSASLGLFDLANFCFLYEEINMRPTFLEEPDSHYSVAETLFSLLATSITAFPGLKEAFSLREGLEQYDGHIGGMSTSMVMFPRPHAERYCADLLGAALLRYWRTANGGTLSDNERKEQERQAQGVAHSLHGWMRESEIRPGTQSSTDTKEYRWPNLSILRDRNAMAANATGVAAAQAQQDPMAHARYSMGRRLKEQSERLFSPLSFEAVNVEYRRQLRGNRRLKRKKVDPESWVNIVEHRAQRSEDAFEHWNSQARVAWVSAREKVLEQVRATFNELSTTNKNGIELAHIYVEELHERLKDVAEELVRLRVHHDEDYAHALSEFAELADGEWVDATTIGAANGSGAVALHPVAAAPQVPNAPTPVPVGPVIIGNNSNPSNPGGPPPPPEFHHMPEREERIARRLAQRVGWHEAQIPALTNIASATFMAAPTLAVLSMGLAPSLNASPLQGIYMAGGIAGVGISSGYVYRLYQQNSVMKAKQDLVNFYRCYYVHRCESREDTLRTLVLSPLMRVVAEMREQLQDMRARLGRVEDILNQDIGNTVQELFDGPAASRDIFVANGERLYRDGRNRDGQPQYTLAQFAARVEQERLEKPKEGFHRTYEEMTARMLHWFDQEGIPILNSRRLSDDAAATRVRQFALGIIRQYLNGSLVDIGAALSDKEVWNFVLDRVKVPLYRFSAGNADAEFKFIAGCERHLAMSQKFTNAQEIHTINTEWLLVSSFFRGNSLFGVDPTTLFPLKSSGGPNLAGLGLMGNLGAIVGPDGKNLAGGGLIENIDGLRRRDDGFLEDEGINHRVTGPEGELDNVEDDFSEDGDESGATQDWEESSNKDANDQDTYDSEEDPPADEQSFDDYTEHEQLPLQEPAQEKRAYQLPRLPGPNAAAGYQVPPSEEEYPSPDARKYQVPYVKRVLSTNDEESHLLPTGNEPPIERPSSQARPTPSVDQPTRANSQVQPIQPGTPENKEDIRKRHQAKDDALGMFNQFAQFLGLPQQPNNPNDPPHPSQEP